MKIWARVGEGRLRQEVEIGLVWFHAWDTTDAIFALRMLMEKQRKSQKELYCVFVDLEKAYDRVSKNYGFV